MSGPEAKDGQSMGAADTSDRARGDHDTADGRDRPKQDPGGAPGGHTKRSPSRAIVITIVGGLVTAAAITAVVAPDLLGGKKDTVTTEESILEPLAPADINAALATLDPTTSKAAVDDAKACKAPLAWVTLVQRGPHGGMVRVRSGSYLSPPIQLTPAPQRVAIPFPAPYPTGRGILSLVGEADQVGFFLRPGGIRDVHGTHSTNVWWRTDKPCP
jgi:hypothetical protein